jgi:hypothetical protein
MALKQLVAEVTLHGLDLGADRRLADTETLGRFTEISILRDSDKHLEPAKRQCHDSPFYAYAGRWYCQVPSVPFAEEWAITGRFGKRLPRSIII